MVENKHISFEILGIDSQSSVALLSSHASKYGVVLELSKNSSEIVASGLDSNLNGFFNDVDSLFAGRVVRGDLVEFFLHRLKSCRLSICVAESCTGGFLSSLLTNINGSSSVYKGGVVAYSIESKKNILDIKDSIFDDYGVYSEECVGAMARGALDLFNADIAIATSGLTTSDTSSNNFLNLNEGMVFTCVLFRSRLPILISQNYLLPHYIETLRLHSSFVDSNAFRYDRRLFVKQQASLWAIRAALDSI